MKKLVAILMCLSCLIGLAACNDESTTDNSTESVEKTTMTIDCKYYDEENENFTDDTIITITIPDNYESTNQEMLLHQSPIYQIGEYRNNQKIVSIFQYDNPEFDITVLNPLGDNWYIDETVLEDSVKTFYTKIDNTILGISISNINKNALSTEDGVAALNFLVGKNLTYVESEPITPDYAEASLENPAHVGDWVSLRFYNKYSNEYEPILFSITKLYEDLDPGSMIEKYNNSGKLMVQNAYYDDKINITFDSINRYSKDDSDIVDMIYEYSIYFPSSYSADGTTIDDTVVDITLCNLDDTSNAIYGNIDLYKSVHDFNDVYKYTATVGEDFTNGMGTYAMYKDYAEYLLKINTPDGPKYFSVK